MRLPVPKRLRDLSLRHKILLANFLMVLVPVLLIAVLGTLIFAGLRFTGTLRQAELALLWPERGAAMSVSYAVSDLRWQSERGGKKAEKFAEACRLLEQNGVQVVILRRTPADAPPRAKGSGGKPEAQAGNEAEVRAGSGAPPAAPPEPRTQGTLPEETVQSAALLYVSSGANAAEVVRQARRSIGAPNAEGTRWQQGEFAFVHRAHSGCDVYAYGRLPLPAPGQEDAEAEYMKSAVEGLAFFGLLLALVFMIWLGLLLARLISRQVLDPLQALRQAAAEVGRGNLSGRLVVRSHDEVGETCACFDKMRADLLAAREAQERYEQGRRELIAGISHDLSTPLTAISGYATGLADGIARTPERRRRYAERITALVAQLSHLVDRLFLFSRLDLGRVAFRCEPVAVDDCLRAWVRETRTAWEAQGHALSYEAAPDASRLSAMLDREEFFRVLENLQGNSLKYAGDAAGHVAAELRLAPEGDCVRIIWRDHGPGVAADELTRIFESFYRADKSRGERPGHGLGMAIAARIVEGMGGRIWAGQAAGGGLAVCMEFPALPQTEETGVGEGQTAPERARTPEKEHEETAPAAGQPAAGKERHHEEYPDHRGQ